MADNPFIQIDAPQLCVMEHEAEELCNDGIYGKALAEYLQRRLTALGYAVPDIGCEDWGWSVFAKIDGFGMEICVYGFARENDARREAIYAAMEHPPEEPNQEPAGVPLNLCVCVGTRPRKYWSWRRFRFVDRTEAVLRLNRDLLEIFEKDPEMTVVGCSDEFPLP